MSERNHRSDPWGHDEDDAALGNEEPFKSLTREEAQALRAKNPPVSPWRVIVAQVAVGSVVAMLAWLITGRTAVMWSALYGSATVVVPGAVLARGLTRRLSSTSPGTSAMGFVVWEFAKIGISVVMLTLAPKVVSQLSWPALLVGLVAGIKVYWAALLWRRR